MIAIATYATSAYCYAQAAQAPLIAAALRYARVDPASVMFIFVGDASKECKAAFGEHDKRMKAMGVEKIERLILDVACNKNGKHGQDSNLVIARMQQAAFDAARCAGATLFWSVEADILPPANTLRSLMDTLTFDRGFYDVAMCTYPNERFLGGYGNPRNWIAPTVYPDERDVPEDLGVKLAARDERQRSTEPPTEDEIKEWQALDKAVEDCPPKGNVFARNAPGWRPRGWLEDAYPGIGLGGTVMTYWTGMGCTLLSEDALHVANFIGYDGGCTQDLWLCWRCWHPAAMRLAVVTHSVCSHVKLKDGKPVIHHATHELAGARAGHLNNHSREWSGL
jgi:hypothetical protein